MSIDPSKYFGEYPKGKYVEREPITKDKLVELFKEKERAKQYLEGIGYMNIANKTPKERIEIDLVHRKAEDKYGEALREYERALGEVSKND